MTVTYRWDRDERTWAVICDEDESVIERGYHALSDAMTDVGPEDCTTCAERVAEARSGIPREYAEI